MDIPLFVMYTRRRRTPALAATGYFAKNFTATLTIFGGQNTFDFRTGVDAKYLVFCRAKNTARFAQIQIRSFRIRTAGLSPTDAWRAVLLSRNVTQRRRPATTKRGRFIWLAMVAGAGRPAPEGGSPRISIFHKKTSESG